MFEKMTSFLASEDEMAKAQVNQKAVDAYVSELAGVGIDKAAFEGVFSRLASDSDLRPVDLAAIALAYRGGGQKPKSGKAARELIRHRFVELARTSSMKKAAAGSRPW